VRVPLPNIGQLTGHVKELLSADPGQESAVGPDEGEVRLQGAPIDTTTVTSRVGQAPRLLN